MTRTNRGAAGISGRVVFADFFLLGSSKKSFGKNSDSPIQKGVPLDYENNGNNLVLYAGWLCKPDIVRFFLQKGLPPNLTDEANLRRPSDGNLACYQEAKILIDQLSK
ncbi:hypothetical protein [Methylomonas sp. MK1]|uniref:hypothetical protein n=1 Tax=Methylomonas sp. MK1 TaxID=1131552 RepID=UPI00039B3EA7|nr:hypothetical protein [Methylomonas sp. MK1]